MRGWPLLDDVRGRVMLVLHARGPHAEPYTEGSPSLEGRAMFLESQEGKPYASVFFRDDPNDASIAKLVGQGYVVRTQADDGLTHMTQGDLARREAALAGGAHVVSTHYPVNEAHVVACHNVALPGGVPARPNPLNGTAR